MRERLAADLAANYDYAIHLGQAGGSSRLRLEAVGINVAGRNGESKQPLVDDGPVAYRTPLPLDEWASALNAAGVPSTVSYHAGTFLCNATLYLSCYLAERMALATQAAFIHLPLDVTQTAGLPSEHPALPSTLAGAGLRIILQRLAGEA
jgi:pyroglutamyl-peptidase